VYTASSGELVHGVSVIDAVVVDRVVASVCANVVVLGLRRRADDDDDEPRALEIEGSESPEHEDDEEDSRQGIRSCER